MGMSEAKTTRHYRPLTAEPEKKNPGLRAEAGIMNASMESVILDG